MQRSALCRSRREFSNEHFLAKFGIDTAENEPCKVGRLGSEEHAASQVETSRERATSDLTDVMLEEGVQRKCSIFFFRTTRAAN